MSRADESAFPDKYNPTTGGLERTIVRTGLSKRELFAAMAMQGMLAGRDSDGAFARVAQHSVQHADALLAELEKSDAK